MYKSTFFLGCSWGGSLLHYVYYNRTKPIKLKYLLNEGLIIGATLSGVGIIGNEYHTVYHPDIFNPSKI